MVGTAPSFSKAPFADESWEIWATGQAAAEKLPRLSRFYELHAPSADHMSIPGFRDWLAKQTVYSFHPVTPDAKPYPRAEVEAAFGGTFGGVMLSSSIAWMLAHCLHEGMGPGDMVGVFGVDMLIEEEYGYQRAGCLHFLDKLDRAGVSVVLPPESGLLLNPKPYPNNDPHTNFIRRELAECRKRKAALDASVESLRGNARQLQGRIDAYEAVLGTMA